MTIPLRNNCVKKPYNFSNEPVFGVGLNKPTKPTHPDDTNNHTNRYKMREEKEKKKHTFSNESVLGAGLILLSSVPSSL